MAKTKLKKFQTNLDDATIKELRARAAQMGVSEAAVARALILSALNGGAAIVNGNTFKAENRRRPKACPACEAEKDDLDNPALTISGNKWSCYVCGAKGTW